MGTLKGFKDFSVGQLLAKEEIDSDIIEASDLPDYIPEGSRAIKAINARTGVHRGDTLSSTVDPQDHRYPMDPPNVLIMRRKTVRTFPGGQRVAMYYVDKINKYVTVPYIGMQWGVAGPEETEHSGDVIEEGIIDHLKDIANKGVYKAVKFKDGSSMKVDKLTASAVLKVHSAMDNENQEKLANHMHKSRKHFAQGVNFAWKHISGT